MRLSKLIGLEAQWLSPHLGDPIISNVALDSRKVTKGTLFAALPGSNVDGIKFVPSAIAQGAVAVLVDADCVLKVPDGVHIISTPQPSVSFAKLAARFFAPQPQCLVAVTGTNGKTSIASFFRQMVKQLGVKSGQVGTTGALADGVMLPETLTSPDAATLHRVLNEMAAAGVGHVALEASSHGLHQHRIDGCDLKAMAFTNLSQDHLDYHETMEDYRDAKARLFVDFGGPEKTAIINMQSETGPFMREAAEKAGSKILTYGGEACDIAVLNREISGLSQILTLSVLSQDFVVKLPLAGQFQVENAMAALGLVIGCDFPVDDAVKTLEHLQGAPGRLEPVGETAKGASVFIDYAHTPDAIVNALNALRPNTSAALHVILGAGGDRDPTKREAMGRAACEGADIVWVSDDNPRNEDPALIRQAVMLGCPKANQLSPRDVAIEQALGQAKAGDVVLIAGKGHEAYQEIGNVKHAYSDHLVVEQFLKNERKGQS